jgi:putative chitinase
VINRKAFYDIVRPKLFGGTMTQQQVDGCEAILTEWEKRGLTDCRWLAYMLATAKHETNATMAAVREAYWLSEDWRRTHLRYWPYYGRGLVQLTWEANYRAMSPVTGVDLIANPDLALDLGNSVEVMFYGMEHGTFTGRRLADYFNGIADNPVEARRIINGTDKAQLVAAYHFDFLTALKASAACEKAA